jgi:4-alpha-glucanotransferase
MTQQPYDPPVLRLAEIAGVTTEWVDAWGGHQEVTQDDLLAVLSALTGHSLDTQAEFEGATDELLAALPDIEPVVVAWNGLLPDIAVPVHVISATVELEDAGEIAGDVTDGVVRVTGVLPIGYHELVINGDEHVSHIVSAPMKAHPTPYGVLGLISPTYSLKRIEPDIGIGTIADLRTLTDLCLDWDTAVVGTLPLLAAFPDQPSPYAPASRRAWNELFVDFSRIPGWEGTLPTPTGDPLWVDYDAVGHDVRSRLTAYSDYVSRTPRLRYEVDRFLEVEPEMRRYAEFRALADLHGRNWRAWSHDLIADLDHVAYHETVQWLMQIQLEGLSSGLEARGQYLYLDLPIGCHPDGYDIWDDPALFAPASLGAPPDPLFVGGQDWGLPASIPSRAREDGHANFRKAIRRQLSVAGLLRIDHVMGIHRTWWVPHGASATQGAYVAQPTEEMFAIICVESQRAGAGVVGENLGTVPPEIHQGLVAHELLGMAIAQDGVSEPKRTDLVALSSHDTPAFAAWWKADDVEDLLDLGVFDEERAVREREERAQMVFRLQERFGTSGPVETRDALMTWMAGTKAAVALINLDDLLMEERRQNVPGTDWERPNWRLRDIVTLDAMAADQAFAARMRGLAAQRPDPSNENRS